MNYTTKTQYIFRINKGVLDENNDNDLNRYTPDQLRDIPFTNMIYIGDGLTDVPCMKLVTDQWRQVDRGVRQGFREEKNDGAAADRRSPGGFLLRRRITARTGNWTRS